MRCFPSRLSSLIVTPADASTEDDTTAASGARKVFTISPADDGWLLEESAEPVPQSTPTGTAISSHRRQRTAIRKACRLARRQPGGAQLRVEVEESFLRLLLDADLRSRWIYILGVASALISATAAVGAPEVVISRSNLLAALGVLFVAVAVTVVAQAAFAEIPPQRDHVTLRRCFAIVIARCLMLAVSGVCLLVTTLLGGTIPSGSVAIFIQAGSTTLFALFAFLLLLSALMALVDYARAAYETPEDGLSGRDDPARSGGGH